MIGKFINPIVSGGAPPTPSAAGIYVLGPVGVRAYDSNEPFFNNIAVLNSSDFSIDSNFTTDINGFPRAGAGVLLSRGLIFNFIEQPDNKIVVVGVFTSYGNGTSGGVTRLNSDGSFDTSFNSGQVGAAGSFMYAVALQSDGKILIGGEHTTYNGVSNQGRITRLNTDGSEDTTFIKGTGFNGTVRTIEIQPDGKILVGGSFTSYNGTTSNRLIRLNADGTIDTSFNIGSGFTSDVYETRLLSDGKIYVVGSFSGFNSFATNFVDRLVRLNPDGSRDTSFARNLSIGSSMFTVCPQSDGRVLIGGQYCPGGDTTACGILRFSSTGVLDTTLVKPGFYSSPVIRKIIEQPDGKLIICGDFEKYEYTYSSKIIRLNSDLTIDTTFSPLNFQNSLQKVLILSNGKILIGGSESVLYRNNEIVVSSVVKLDNYNTLNKSKSSIGFITSSNLFLNFKINVDSDDNILITGEFLTRWINSIAKFNSDIVPFFQAQAETFYISDFSSDTSTIITNSFVTKNNKYFITGNITNVGNSIVRNIARLNSDFSVDSSFDTNQGFTFGGINFATTIAETSDSKFYLGINSNFNVSYSGVSRQGILRINNNGSIDTSFVPLSFSLSSSIDNIIVQPDDKLIVSGGMSFYGAFSRNRIARINPDASLDTTFDPGTGFDSAPIKIKLQSDGKIVAIGGFTSYNGIFANRIVRINPDGSYDTSFVTGTGFIDDVFDLEIGSDGKIYVIGNFSSYNNTECIRYCVLDSNGSIIPTNIKFSNRPLGISIIE